MLPSGLDHLLPRRVLSPWELDDISDVLDAAVEWEQGRLPLAEFARVGSLVYEQRGDRRTSPAYTRHVALRTALPGDPRLASLRKAIAALVANNPRQVVTRHGVFQAYELIDAGVTVKSGEASS